MGTPAESSAAPAASPASSEAQSSGSSGSNDDGNQMLSGSGSEFEEMVSRIAEMGFDREQIVLALQASYNNPDRAIEYLMNGTPENVLRDMTASQQGAGGGNGGASSPSGAASSGAASGAAPSSGS